MSSANALSTRRFSRRLILSGLAVVLISAWFWHAPVVEKLIRYGLKREAARAGLVLEIGDIQSHLARPLIVSRIRLRAKEERDSRTAAEIDRVVIVLNWPWRAFFGDRRWIRFAAVENLRGVFECGTPESSAGPESVPSPRQALPSTRLPYLPETVRISRASFEILAGTQSYFFQDLSAEFSEDALNGFSAAGAEIHAGPVNESFGSLKGTTAWKNGRLYLADLTLRDGIRLADFQIDLARPGKLEMTVEAEVFGGAVRGDLTLEGAEEPATVSVWAAGTQLKPLGKFLGAGSDADGVLREVRFTFRGNSARLLDGQASLRLAADGFRWKERGWESLQIGASLSGRRLSVSDFTFRQKDNTLSLNGDLSLTENGADLSRAPFLLNVSASVKNLGALAGLFGPPFDEMSGRMSLSGSVNGKLGAINGFLSAEGSGMGFRDRPIESGRLEVTFVNSEAQVTQCELWSGLDYIRGKGTVQLTAPHQYAGELQARVEDVAAYLGLLRTKKILPIEKGIAQIRWQGDGTATAHSGAFQVGLDKFVSSLTPTGLTGRFAGTYSPQNIYFSGVELAQGPLRFSTRATLASSGVRLQDSVLVARGREIADADIFLPVDPFALTAGKTLNDAILVDQPLYANVATRGALTVRDLFRLAGNDLPATGTLRFFLRASGNPAAPVIEGKLEGRGLGFESGQGNIPPSQIDATVRAADGTARVRGEWKLPGNPAASVELETPLAFRSGAGAVSWWNATDQIAGRLDIPRFDLARLRPLFARLQRLGGVISAKITAAGTAEKPRLEGTATLTDGVLEPGPHSPLIDQVKAAVKITPTQILTEKVSGRMGGGPFAATGEIRFDDGAKPFGKFAFSGTKVLLANGPGLRLPANIQLEGEGRADEGQVSGSVRFTEADFSQKLEITPVLVPSTSKSEILPPPSFFASIPASLAAWKLNVEVKNDGRFSLGGAESPGELIPDLRLAGTLAKPVPVGQISLTDARAYFPYTILSIPTGSITFLESAPWIPQLDLRGTALALDYEVQAYAFGPLYERRLILRSDPGLPQTDIVTLLANGYTPGVFGGGKSSLVLRPFARQLEPLPDSAAQRARAELWQALALEDTRSALGLLGPRLSYLYRFVPPK
jgi:hypothetical protein